MTLSTAKLIQNICLLIPTLYLSVITTIGIVMSLITGNPITFIEEDSNIASIVLIAPLLIVLFNVYIFVWNIKHNQATHRHTVLAIFVACLYFFGLGVLSDQFSVHNTVYFIAICGTAIWARHCMLNATS